MSFSQVQVRVNLPTPSTVTHVSCQTYKDYNGGKNLGVGCLLYDEDDNQISITFGNSGTYNLAYYSSPEDAWVERHWDGSVPLVAYAVFSAGSDSEYGTAWIKAMNIRYI